MSEPGGALHWSKTGALALAGAVLLPALAAAQRTNPIYRPTMQDLGDWDAVVDVRLHDGRRQKARGRETNTVGCDGRCVVSKVRGALDVYGGMSPLRGRGNARFPDRGPGYDEDGTAATVTELERRPWQSRGGSKL